MCTVSVVLIFAFLLFVFLESSKSSNMWSTVSAVVCKHALALSLSLSNASSREVDKSLFTVESALWVTKHFFGGGKKYVNRHHHPATPGRFFSGVFKKWPPKSRENYDVLVFIEKNSPLIIVYCFVP